MSRMLTSLLVLLVGLVAATSSALAQELMLKDVARSAGVVLENVCGSHTAKRYILEQNGSGGAVFDYDGDGDLDLFLVNGADAEILSGESPPVRNALYRNEGDWNFLDLTEKAGLGDEGWGMGVAVGDIDKDGDDDLYVSNFGPNLLYENLGDGSFRNVTQQAGVGETGWGHSTAFGDIDQDGDLDLYVANNLLFDFNELPDAGRPCHYRRVEVACGPIGFPKQPDHLFRNDGDLRFTDVSEISGVHAPDPEHGLGLVFADLDEDGTLDIYVANDSGPNFFFRGLGEGRFEEIAWLAGIATQSEGRFQAGMGVAVGDANGDLRPDIFLTNFARDHNTLHLNQGEGFFSDDSYPSGLGSESWPYMGWGTRFVDLDQDTDRDLYIANGHIYPEVDAGLEDETYRQVDHLLLNDGQGNFVPTAGSIEKQGGPGVSRGIAFGDLDEDGDIDLLIVEMGSTPSLLRNEGKKGNYLQVGLRGSESSRDGAGARLRLRLGESWQGSEVTRSGSYCSSSDPSQHFGLGKAERIDELEIDWPLGKKQRYLDIPPNRELVVFEAKR